MPDPHQLLARFQQGAELFNAGNFFDCHEAWEDVWRELQGEPRLFVQGLIQIAVALHHASRWNVAGARGVFSRAVTRLEPFTPEYGGVQVASLIAGVAPWRAAIEMRENLPPCPVFQYDPEKTKFLFGPELDE